MMIDEAIESLKYDFEIDMHIRDIAPQLAEWLEELKAYREIGTVEGYKNAIECYTEEYTIRKSDIQYNKAIDDFVKALIPRLTDAIYPKDVEGMRNLINDVAEHLKAH